MPLSAFADEEANLRELHALDQSDIEFDFYQEENTTPSDEQTLIEALELLESSIDNGSSGSASVSGSKADHSTDMSDPIEHITKDQESINSQLLETIEDEMESNIEQGLEAEIFEIFEEELENEFEEPEDIFNEDEGDFDE